MESIQGYVRKNGLPVRVYFDRHTTYRSTRRLTVEEELAGVVQPLSEFEWALTELGVGVIHAYSPEAKGRIARLFGTFRDRLVNEMRLRGISTKDEANAFLREYLPIHTAGSLSSQPIPPIFTGVWERASTWIDIIV